MAGPNYQFGSFFVDRHRYRVVRDDVVVELTPKLLDLLLHLLDHSGALVTKEQLLDALWPGANVTDNALAQAVSFARTGAALLWITNANVSVANRNMIATDSQP